jgi:catechol 2,3-dioxygenase-like lactoylglutathione lyase family enzyme
MDDLTIGDGSMLGKGLYAARNFKKGEVVVQIDLKPISFKELKALAPEEYLAAHNLNGQIYLFGGGLAKYVNHSETPNVVLDLSQKADLALRDITAGEKITADISRDDVPVLKKVDAVLIKVPSIVEGLDFYREQLGMQTVWRREDMAAVRLGDSELVLSTKLDPEIDMLVDSVDEAVKVFENAGGSVLAQPEDIPVGRVAVVQDPFGNSLTLVDLSKGTYKTDGQQNVTGVVGT